MYFNIKNKNKFFYKILIHLFLLVVVISKISSKNLAKRFLLANNTDINNKSYHKETSRMNSYERYQYINNEEINYNKTKNSTRTSYHEDPGSYLLAWFVIFLAIGGYMICEMKKYQATRDRTGDVWKFIYMANNGTLLASGINIFDIKNILVDSSPFTIGAIIFIIGSICYIKDFIRRCDKNYVYYYFSYDTLLEWFRLPCFIISLIDLTDPCCRSNSYTVVTYTDGHTESDYCCHVMWNCFIKIMKRLALFFTVLSFYFFLVFFCIFWFAGKLIYYLICLCYNIPPPPPPENPPEKGPVEGGNVNIPQNVNIYEGSQQHIINNINNGNIFNTLQNNNSNNNNNNNININYIYNTIPNNIGMNINNQIPPQYMPNNKIEYNNNYMPNNRIPLNQNNNDLPALKDIINNKKNSIDNYSNKSDDLPSRNEVEANKKIYNKPEDKEDNNEYKLENNNYEEEKNNSNYENDTIEVNENKENENQSKSGIDGGEAAPQP